MSLNALKWPVAILDIGSNSVKLAVYDRKNLKKAFFSEKVLCQLGQKLSSTGQLDRQGKKTAKHAIAGFTSLAKALNAGSIHVLGTAALRDARDGPIFVRSVHKALGVRIRVLSGEEEAKFSALGVLRHISDAEGIVLDLGGGSLELAQIKAGAVQETKTFPLGTLRLKSYRHKLASKVSELLVDVPPEFCGPWPLYAVGGTSRALAIAHGKLEGPQGKTKSYRISLPDLRKLSEKIEKIKSENLARDLDIEPLRARVLPEACQLLATVMERLGSSELIITSASMRDGYLYDLCGRKKKT